jgi:hypothetical protein
MDVALISELFGYVAVSCGFTMTTLQAVRIQRHGPAGVSPLAWSLFLWVNTFFAVYGWAMQYWPVAIGASIISPIMLFVVAKTGWRSMYTTVPLAFGVVVVASMIPVAIWGWPAGIPGAIVINVALTLPAIVALYKSESAEGASAASWLINGSATALLTVSALLRKDWVFAGGQALICISNLATGLLTIQRHRHLRRNTLEVAAAS